MGTKLEQRRQRRLDRLAAVKSLKEAGLTGRQIAKRMQVPEGTIYVDLLELGLRTYPSKAQLAQRKELVCAHRAAHPGMSLRSCAKALGLSRNMVAQAAPGQRRYLGSADHRISVVYEALVRHECLITAAILMKAARTSYWTAQSWLSRKIRPEFLRSLARNGCEVKAYERTLLSGEKQTVDGYRRQLKNGPRVRVFI